MVAFQLHRVSDTSNLRPLEIPLVLEPIKSVVSVAAASRIYVSATIRTHY
jgi:hypothetical protein